VLKARLSRMKGYGSQRKVTTAAFSMIHTMTQAVCVSRYAGVPKNLATFSATCPNSSEPKGEARWA
jgi:hypothetical protein